MSGRPARLVGLLLVMLTLAGCDPSRMAQAMADRIMSAPDRARVAGFLADTRAGRLDAARRRFAADDRPPVAELAALQHMLACCGPPRLMQFNARKRDDRPWRVRLGYQLGHGHDAHALRLVIDGAGAQRALRDFGFGHSVDLGAAMRSALRWTGAAAGFVLLLTAALLWRRRRRTSHSRRL